MRVFNIDITRKGISPVVQVTEYDAMSRFFTLVLRNGSSDYEPPENPTYSVWYKTKDSTGWYDTITLPDESTRPAVVADGNAFTIEIAEQATTSCGELALMINGDDGYQLTISGIITRSDDIPGYDGEEVENYYNVYIADMQKNAARAENAAQTAIEYGATIDVEDETLIIDHYDDAGEVETWATVSEAWAVGKRNGVDVPSTDETYHNNSKYYAEQAAQSAASLTVDTELSSTSTNPVQNKVIDATVTELKNEIISDQNILIEHIFVKSDSVIPTIQTGMLKKDGSIVDTITSYSIASFAAEANKVYYIRGLSSGSRYSEIRLIDVGESGYIVPQKNATFVRYIANYAGTVMLCYRNNVTPVIEVGTSYVPVSPTDLTNGLTSIYNQINPIKDVSDYNANDDLTWEIGSINTSTGANMNSSTRIRTIDYIDLIGVSDVKISIGSGYKYCLYWYNSDKTLQSYTSFYTTNQNFTVPANALYLRILVADTSDGTASITYAQQIAIAESYIIVKSVNDLTYGFNNSNLLLAEKAMVSTLMPIRYGIRSAITGLKIVSGRTYVVTITPATAIDLESSSNSISVIVYDSDMTVKIRLGGVPTSDYVFTDAYTVTFTATEDIVNAVLGAYIVLPAVADYKITFEIKEVTIDNLVYDVDRLKNNNLMPVYYKSYMENRIETIRALDAEIGNSGDSFVFATDLHETNAYNSPYLIKYIIENSAVGNIFYGGDYINQPSSKTLAIKTLQNNIAKLRVSNRAVFLEGNHETNPYGTGQLTPQEVYGIINKRIERYINTHAKNYYYIDNESQKIRYIVIDTGEDGDIDATQEAWVGATASALTSDWVIIILSHMAVYTSGKDVRDNIQKYDVVDKVLGAISEISAKVACWVCGHTHKDFSYATTNFPIISVTCDANGNQASTYTSDDRTAGTINEQAFDVFHIDTDSKTVYATRIGGGQNNVITTDDLTDNDRQWSYT